MKRAIIIVKGRVQRVGYRDLVADWAMDLGVVGFVENQPDGTVKIVAEGEEERLEEFIRKAQPEDDPLIRIAQVDVGYEKATGEFELFKIKRGSSEEETAERLDTAAKSLKVLIKTTAMMNENLGNKIDASREGNKQGFATLTEKQDQMLGKQGQMIEKQDQTISIIKSGVEETRDFRTEISDNFITLREDYGKISENIEKLIQSIDRTSKNTERILEEMKEERKESRMAMDKILNAILKLAEKAR